MDYDRQEYPEETINDAEEYRPPRRKKKKPTLKKYIRALGRYLASLPPKALVFTGGVIIIILVVIILLVTLLPKSGAQGAEPEQLTLTDAASPSPTLAPLATAAPTPEPTATPGIVLESRLELWSVSDVVATVQQRLAELGYMDMPTEGYTTTYGPATKNGIRRFQIRNFESPDDWDGICGQKTLDLLMAADAKGFWYLKGDTDDSLYVDKMDGVVQEGWVTRLQKRLIELKYLDAATKTGTYGTTTVASVKQFQVDNGLVADGSAGQETLKLLYSTDAVDAETAKLRGTPVPSDAAGTTPKPGTTSNPGTTPAGASPDASVTP